MSARAPWPAFSAYQAVHLLAHVPVLGVALWGGAQLEHVHGGAGVELHAVADPVGEGNGVRGHGGAEILPQRLVQSRPNGS